VRRIGHLTWANHYFKILKELGAQLDNALIRAPYVITCAATLEYLLNDIILSYSLHTSDSDASATLLARSLSTLSFRSKLTTLPHVITSGRLTIDTECETYKTLSDLISTRNRLVHNKPVVVVVESENEDRAEIGFKNKDLLTSPVSIDKSQCHRYRHALLEFLRCVHDGMPDTGFDPDALQPSTLLRQLDQTTSSPSTDAKR
jgi:hypothetical protein